MDFELLIVGMDANAYYMARCYHEKYNKKAYLIGKNSIWFTDLSEIVNTKYVADLWNEEVFLEELKKFYLEHADKKILLVSSTENYIRLISNNKEKLSNMYYFNYPDNSIIDNIINKELFYKTYENSIISLPKTIYYDCSSNEEVSTPFTYPVIVKAANVVSYRKLDFIGKNKIYKLESYEELKNTIQLIKDGGYKDTLIIQEYIPGDDSHLFDAVIYSDKNGKVKRISFAQIGLQEHAKDMVGNAAIMINGFNTFGVDTTKIIEDIVKFSEKIGYKGFAEFDLKYDSRDNTFKVLEINARQGRSSYYLTPAGCNLIEVLAKDLIFNEELEYQVLDKEVMLTFIPKGIVKKYVVNDEFKKKALSMWKDRVNPMKYNKDKNMKRNYFLLRRDIKYFKDYKNGYWKNS